MGKYLVGIFAVLLVLGGSFCFWRMRFANAPEITINSNNMQITSPAFAEGENIPPKYSCDGDKINPPFNFSGIPENAKSLVFIMDDPDVPVGIFTHWIIWNIGPNVTEIAENSVPKNATQGVTSANTNSYVGPCPPVGTHRYFFKLYALNKELQLDQSAKVGELMKAMEGHTVARAELMGTYGR